jgi:hypothetical protein
VAGSGSSRHRGASDLSWLQDTQHEGGLSEGSAPRLGSAKSYQSAIGSGLEGLITASVIIPDYGG